MILSLLAACHARGGHTPTADAGSLYSPYSTQANLYPAITSSKAGDSNHSMYWPGLTQSALSMGCVMTRMYGMYQA